jgi:hypothetical protein
MKNDLLLTAWRKKQVALLYYFASMDYLKGLKARLYAIAGFSEDVLDTSRRQGRDSKLRSARWGNRDTSENWANNAWSFLVDFKHSIARDIADRASQTYHVTGTYQCGRGMSEYSMQWMTPQEQEQFDKDFEELSRYASNIDRTMEKVYQVSRWNDFGLTLAWNENATHFPKLPKFQVLTDVIAESGSLPSRTGVYIPIDDPNGVAQFAWTGGGQGKLLDCATFNDLGKAALAAVGRANLWTNGDAMLDFVLKSLSNPELQKDSFFKDSKHPDHAPSLVARNAFTSHPSRWCYVEMLDGQFEEIDSEAEEKLFESPSYESGEVCLIEGVYFTPAQVNSRRRISAGEVFPDLGGPYGKTIWQWDLKQD